MSKTKRIANPGDQLITRREAQELIVHVINQVFAQMAEPPKCVHGTEGDCTTCAIPDGGYEAVVSEVVQEPESRPTAPNPPIS